MIRRGYLNKYINIQKKEEAPLTHPEHRAELDNLPTEGMVGMILGLSHD